MAWTMTPHTSSFVGHTLRDLCRRCDGPATPSRSNPGHLFRLIVSVRSAASGDAILAFQRSQHLTVDGIVGASTWAALI